MKKTFSLLLFTSLVLAGCSLNNSSAPVSNSAKEPAQPTSVESNNPEQQSKTISLDEISQHASPEDCWFAVDGNVYDVTSYIAAAKHPGGEAILEGCGKDASGIFHTKPGTGNDHSPKAQEYLQSFKIGQLE
ncbi:MAG: cytochrome b5 domain-containing protein [Patescibacteria group bacterium]